MQMRSSMRCASFCDVQGRGCVARKTGLLDTGALHASNCALSKATRGHNAVAQIVQEAADAGDTSAETEASGLIPGTELRPADVLTSALGNACQLWTSPSALPTLMRLASTAPSPWLTASSPTTASLEHPPSTTHPPSGAPMADPLQHVDRLAQSQQVHLAQA